MGFFFLKLFFDDKISIKFEFTPNIDHSSSLQQNWWISMKRIGPPCFFAKCFWDLRAQGVGNIYILYRWTPLFYYLLAYFLYFCCYLSETPWWQVGRESGSVCRLLRSLQKDDLPFCQKKIQKIRRSDFIVSSTMSCRFVKHNYNFELKQTNFQNSQKDIRLLNLIDFPRVTFILLNTQFSIMKRKK